MEFFKRKIMEFYIGNYTLQIRYIKSNYHPSARDLVELEELRQIKRLIAQRQIGTQQ